MKHTLSIFFVFVLCAIGFGISLLGYQDAYITSFLVYQDGPASPTALITQEYPVQGTIAATENNLATLKLRVRTFNRLNTTHITFRLRERGSVSWLVSNIYVIDRFPDGLLYPFGFVPIADSKGKTYEFELSSDDATPDNAIGIERGYHDQAAQYVFQKSSLLHDKQVLKIFIWEKFRSMVTDPYMVLYTSIFIIPALAFFIRHTGNYKRSNAMIFTLATYISIVYTYIPIGMHSNIILFVATAEIFLGFLFDAPASLFYIGALVWLIQIPPAIIMDNTLIATKSAMLVLVLFSSGAIMSIFELKKN